MSHDVSDKSILELVDRIYAASCDPSEWRNVARDVNKLVPGVGFSILLSLKGTGLDAQSANAGIDPQFIQTYISTYQFMNPYIPLFSSLKVGTVYTPSMLIPPDWLQRQSFFHEWLKPAGSLTHGASVIVARDKRRMMRVSFDIPTRQAALETPCAKLLRRLSPHLRRAFELNERFQASTVATQSLSGVLNNIDSPAFLVAQDGRTLFFNDKAEQLITNSSILGVDTNNRLYFRHSANQDLYGQVLSSAFNLNRNGPQAFSVCSRDRHKHAVIVLPFRPISSAAQVSAPPQAIVLIRSTSPAQAAEDMLRQLYGLTHAEACVAAKISTGLSVTETAQELGVSRTTARNQLAAAMQKVGVHRQGELVATIAALIPRLYR